MAPVKKTVEVAHRTNGSFRAEENPLFISSEVSALFFGSASGKGNSATKQNGSCKDNQKPGKSLHQRVALNLLKKHPIMSSMLKLSQRNILTPTTVQVEDLSRKDLVKIVKKTDSIL